MSKRKVEMNTSCLSSLSHLFSEFFEDAVDDGTFFSSCSFKP